ncbi:MAG: VWA domain-containing protein [Acidobacteria bacterium]|nr:VWA domain-containing protein [Acidobacteriota bacterium]
MSRKMFIRYLPAALTILLLPIFAVAQSPVARDSQQDIIRLNTNLVVIDAQVLNRKSGEVINGLKVDDFELYEDGVRQDITHFSQDKLALSVMLLIDLSGSVSPVLNEIREGALTALNRLKDVDEVAVMAFSTKSQIVQDFTRDRVKIIDRIGKIERSPVVGQGTLIFQALREASHYMARATNPASRRVIITITDNVSWDYYGYGPSEQEVSDDIIESGSMVCGLIVEGSLSRAEKIFRRDKDGKDIFRRRMSVDPFANQTGGELLKTPSFEISERLAQLIDHLRTRYSLGFTSKRDSTDGRYHRLKLALSSAAQKRLGDVLIRTKEGYYARQK